MPRDWARCPLRCSGKSRGGSERLWVSARQLTEELRRADKRTGPFRYHRSRHASGIVLRDMAFAHAAPHRVLRQCFRLLPFRTNRSRPEARSGCQKSALRVGMQDLSRRGPAVAKLCASGNPPSVTHITPAEVSYLRSYHFTARRLLQCDTKTVYFRSCRKFLQHVLQDHESVCNSLKSISEDLGMNIALIFIFLRSNPRLG